MAQSSVPELALPFPDVNPADLHAFHETHFSTLSLSHFSTQYLGPVINEEVQDDVEDDGLGYYPDGVKRTLTDEQIAIFRHSEIQALLRKKRHAEENRVTPAREDNQTTAMEEGELEDDQDTPASASASAAAVAPPPPPPPPPSTTPPEAEPPRPASKAETRNAATGNVKRQKAEKWKGRGHKQPPRPDLRKRTWDKVDRGLQSLDYGEENEDATALPAASQQRRISYGDV